MPKALSGERKGCQTAQRLLYLAKQFLKGGEGAEWSRIVFQVENFPVAEKTFPVSQGPDACVVDASRATKAVRRDSVAAPESSEVEKRESSAGKTKLKASVRTP